MFFYRQARPNEISPTERRFTTSTVEICSNTLRIRQPELRFMVESYTGEIARQERIMGLQRDRDIYVLIALTPMELVRTVAHEARHVYQRDTGKHCYHRERDAKIFELEFTLNLRGTTYDELYYSLPALKPAAIPAQSRQPQPAELHPIVSPTPPPRGFRGSPDRKSRIEYCQKLLHKVPNMSPWQRNNIVEEITELEKEMATA